MLEQIGRIPCIVLDEVLGLLREGEVARQLSLRTSFKQLKRRKVGVEACPPVSTILDEILPCLFYQRHQNRGASMKIMELEALPCQPPHLLIFNERFHVDKTHPPPNGHFRNCLSWKSDIFFIVLEN